MLLNFHNGNQTLQKGKYTEMLMCDLHSWRFFILVFKISTKKKNGLVNLSNSQL